MRLLCLYMSWLYYFYTILVGCRFLSTVSYCSWENFTSSCCSRRLNVSFISMQFVTKKRNKEDFLEFFAVELDNITMHPDVERCFREKAYTVTISLMQKANVSIAVVVQYFLNAASSFHRVRACRRQSLVISQLLENATLSPNKFGICAIENRVLLQLDTFLIAGN